LDAGGQVAARQMFARLVSISDNGEFTRRRARLSELRGAVASRDDLEGTLQLFDRNRLLTFDRDPETREPTVEVAHEALFRTWDRLFRWVNEEQDNIRQGQALAGLVADWERADEDESYLLRGGRLAAFEAWLAQTTTTVTAAERAFVQASVARRKREEAAAAEQQAREMELTRRSRNRLRYLLGVAVLGGVITATLALIAGMQAQRADLRAGEAASFTLLANAQRAMALGDMSLAANLLTSAEVTIASEPSIIETAHQLSSEPGIVHLVDAHNDAVTAMAFSEDGTRLITGAGVGGHKRMPGFPEESEGADGPGRGPSDDSGPGSADAPERREPPPRGEKDTNIGVWDVRTGEQLLALAHHQAPVVAIEPLPGGMLVASASTDGQVLIWSLDDGEIEQAYEQFGRRELRLDAAENGMLLVSRVVDRDDTYWMIDTQRGEVIDVVSLDTGRSLIQAAQLPDGNIISYHFTGVQYIWNPATGETLRRDLLERSGPTPEAHFVGAALSPSGLLWASHITSHVEVWDHRADARNVFVLEGADITDLTWLPDGRLGVIQRG
ncbi:MAG: hypothetical protein AAF125_20025, partial [Chloroflexota bacterium]